MDIKPFKIGKYLLLEKIATGGMAEVFRAKASGAGGFEKQLAIKRILPNYASNDEFRRMFEYEARLSSMLTHANIAQIYDFVKHGETYLLAMEFVDGKNLRQFINKAKKLNYVPPVEFGLYIINEVCKGLEYAHKRKDDMTGKSLNVIHRDMSPQNIMLSYDGAVKIVDFGIAKAKDRVDETRSGVIKGKFGYMSPEQANGESIDHRTDIFSTGIILYELLANRRLFAAENDMATLRQIQECVIPSAVRQNPKVTPEMEKIMMKALTKDLGLRYQDAGKFHRGLQEYLNKNFTSFSQQEMAVILQKIFADEIVAEKKRFEAVYRQSIPFSQKSNEANEGDIPEEPEYDEPATKSETRNRSVVTNISGEDIVTSISGVFEKDAPRKRAEPEKDEELSPLTKVDNLMPDEDEPGPVTGAGSRSGTRGGTGSFRPSMPEPASNPTQARTSSTIDRTQITGSAIDDDNNERPTQVTDSRVRAEEDEPKDPGTDPGSMSGISLSDTAANAKGRRRDRSISISRGMSTSGADQNVSLQSMGEQGRQTLDRERDERTRYRDPYTFVEKKRGSPLLKFFLLVILVGLVALLYNEKHGGSGEDGRLPADEGPAIPKPKRFTRRAPQNQEPAPPPTFDSCTFEVSTDPPGAAIFVDRQNRGVSPQVVKTPCDKDIDLTLVLEGYADVQQNIFVKRKMGKIRSALKRVPMGALELTTTGNAEIFLNGQLMGEARANVTFQKKLRAGQKHQIRFTNQILNQDFSCTITIQPDLVEVKKVDMDQGKCR